MAAMAPSKVRKKDRKKIDRLTDQVLRKHDGHKVGVMVESLRSTFECPECHMRHPTHYIISTSCDECKEIISLGIIGRGEAMSMPSLIAAMDEADRLTQKIASRPPPEFERE